MGWKNVKEHYEIKHYVQTTNKGICIGSGYIHDIIVIGYDGKIKKRYDESNADLRRYQNEMDADPEKLIELVNTQDTFSNSVTVYTYSDGQILEKQCETLGWPNVTHDGMIMYENTFSENREKVVEWATRNAELAVKNMTERVTEAESELLKCKNLLMTYQQQLYQLKKNK